MNDPRRALGPDEASYVLAALISGSNDVTTYMSPYQPSQLPAEPECPAMAGDVIPTGINGIIGKNPSLT